jgi:hypothetical protein
LTWSCLQLIKRGDRSGEEELSKRQNQGKTSTTGLTGRSQTKITKKPSRKSRQKGSWRVIRRGARHSGQMLAKLQIPQNRGWLILTCVYI